MYYFNISSSTFLLDRLSEKKILCDFYLYENQVPYLSHRSRCSFFLFVDVRHIIGDLVMPIRVDRIKKKVETRNLFVNNHKLSKRTA